MASTSAGAAWRLVLLIGAPLAFAVTGMLHLVPASEPTAGSDFDHVGAALEPLDKHSCVAACDHQPIGARRCGANQRSFGFRGECVSGSSGAVRRPFIAPSMPASACPVACWPGMCPGIHPLERRSARQQTR